MALRPPRRSRDGGRMIARILRFIAKPLIKRGLKKGAPGSHERLVRRIRARNGGSQGEISLPNVRSNSANPRCNPRRSR